jgi:large subunit ribosomal protein LP2
MKHLAAYLLLALAGNESPSASDIKEVLSSVGIDADSERLEKVVAELQGKNLQDVSFTHHDPILTEKNEVLTF